jgi:P4 family phage/plasmid primase-like protien
MKKTHDNYFLPENEGELAEAIQHNSKLDAEKQSKQTIPEIIKELKKSAPRGYAKGGLKLDNYIDNVEEFYSSNPFFYDKSCMFWLWNKDKYCYERTDEIDIMNLIDFQLGFMGQTVTGGVKTNYLEAFKRVGRKHIPLDVPKEWIQFKNKIVDIKTGTEQIADHRYFSTNPISWNVGLSEDTPVIDKLFTDWQGDNKKVLYEVLAYCLLSDYPIHTIIAMIGSGRNGKSQYQLVIERLLGKDNITSTELDVLIDNRFESAKLYKKLVCSMGETNFNMITKTSLLKKLCGGDLIGYEFKNKMPFTGHNYAKIIINTNSLPPSDDTTEGFYRRWLIINWPNNFSEGKDIVDTIPEYEYENLCLKLIRVLRELLERGNFETQGSIETRKERYILASNPISLFIHQRCEVADNLYVKAKELYHAYVSYLQENKRRTIKRKEFNQLLAEEGYQAEHDKRKVERDGVWDYENSYWIDGLKLKLSPISPFSPSFSLLSPHAEKLSENSQKNGESIGRLGNKVEKLEEISILNKFDDSTTSSMLDYDVLESILLEKPEGWNIVYIIQYGFTDVQLEQWMSQGLIFENPQGTIRLLK